MTCTRRHFIQTAGRLPLAALAGCATSPLAKPAAIIDTHTHFYDPTRPQGVPWPPKDDPLLHRRVLPGEFKDLVQPLGVCGTVVVEASPWEEDNQWVLDLAKKEPFIVGLVGHLKPGHPGFSQHLARFASHRLFRGIRTGLWGVSLNPSDPSFVEDLHRVAERNLALDVLVNSKQLNLVGRLADKLPNLPIVIDHCANLQIDGSSPPEEWVSGIRAAARRPNIHMKVSGLVEGSGRNDQTAPTEAGFYRPVLDVIWEAFGEDRVLYGSNWPVSSRFAGYTTVLQIVKDYVEAQGERSAQKYFRDNAARVYRFVER